MTRYSRLAQAPGLTAAVPALFVFLWSTGFIAAKTGLEDSGPATFLVFRFGLASLLMLLLFPVFRPTWPGSLKDVLHLVILGLLMQVIYFGGAWASMASGVGAGTAALVLSMQPVLTALVAGPVLGERLDRYQWIGLAFGITGVVLVVDEKLTLGLGTVAGMIWCFVALLGITSGTLYQKRFCPKMDVWSGLFIQFVTACAVLLPLAVVEGWKVTWSAGFIAALAWVVVFLSLISVVLLTLMIKRHEASRITSFFFLVPPLTALIAWPLLGETMSPAALAGLGLAVVGVAFAVTPRSRRRRA